MLFGSDWLANLYLGCFLFGLIFTTLSLVLSFVHIGGHARLGHGGHTHGAGRFPGLGRTHSGLPRGGSGRGGLGRSGPTAPRPGAASGHGHHGATLEETLAAPGPLNPSTLLAGLTWFGGAGYLFRTSLGLSGPLSAVLALASGLVGGAILFVIISRVLWQGQTMPMRRADYYLPGTPARVVSSIAAGGTGEIAFYKGGSRRVEGARSLTGMALPTSTEVIIVQYVRGLAYVAPIVAPAQLEGARLDPPLDATTRRLHEC